MTEKRVCVFCGSSDLTREHVFPDWMSKMFKSGTVATTIIEKKGEPDTVFNGALLQHKAKVVCAKCNNGWMSTLESDAKPILSEMLFNLSYTADLGEKEQNTLAFWAQKTTLILNLSTQAEYKISPETYHALYKQRGPIQEITVRVGWRIPKQGKYGPHLSHFTIGDITGPEKASMVKKVGEFDIWRAIIAIGNVVFHVNGATPNIRVEVGNVDSRVTPQIFPYEKDITWPIEWPVDALTSVGLDEFSAM